MSNTSVDVRTGVDGTLVVQPHGAMDSDHAVHLRRILVHAVRRVRPLRLILDLSDVSDVDAINLGALAAFCELAEEQNVLVFVDNSSPLVARQLRAAGVPAQRLRSRSAARAG